MFLLIVFQCLLRVLDTHTSSYRLIKRRLRHSAIISNFSWRFGQWKGVGEERGEKHGKSRLLLARLNKAGMCREDSWSPQRLQLFLDLLLWFQLHYFHNLPVESENTPDQQGSCQWNNAAVLADISGHFGNMICVPTDIQENMCIR